MPPTTPHEANILTLGQALLAAPQHSFFSPHTLTQLLLKPIMRSDTFRTRALRFVDVAPMLRTNTDILTHLAAYFNLPWAKHLPIGFMVAPLAKAGIRHMGKSFIAAQTIPQALTAAQKLNRQNIASTLDLLGEAVLTAEESGHFFTNYLHLIGQLGTTAPHWQKPTYPEHDRVGDIQRANISIKLSALHHNINLADYETTAEILTHRFDQILTHAAQHNVYVHVDMEHYNLLPLTTDVFTRTLSLPQHRANPHVGIVLQAYLKESDAHLNALLAFAQERGTPFTIRLVKGANWDFEIAHAAANNWPVPVFTEKTHTDFQYEHLTRHLITAYPAVRLAFGTHNARSIANIITTAQQTGLDKRDFELQMLYGMAEPFRNYLATQGYRTRVYMPVGELLPGLAYLVRRLLENTANQSFLRQTKEKTMFDLLTPPTPYTPAEQKFAESFTNHPLADFSNPATRTRCARALEKFAHRLPLTIRGVVNGDTIKSDNTHTHLCPFDTTRTITITERTPAHMAASAIDSAHAALPHWRAYGAQRRADILRTAAKLVIDRYDEIFALMVFESGKDWPHTDADIAEGIDFLNYYAHHITRLPTLMQPISLQGEENQLVYEPRGVYAVIAPWNFPFAISIGMVSAALVAGNTVVYKPAEATTAIGKFVCDTLWAAGVPKNVLHFLPSKGSEAGAALVQHPLTAGVAFTGSRDVGTWIFEHAAKVHPTQTHLKKCVIEMGGKNSMIIDNDADLDAAVPAVVQSAFGFQGQKCSACAKVVVVGNAYEPFLARLKPMVEQLHLGAATDPHFHVNAVIDAKAKAKIEGYIATGRSTGKVLAEVAKTNAAGHFIPPIVFTDLPENSPLIHEEIFGPVLVVQHAQTLDEALQKAQHAEYALTGGLFSRNPASIAKIQKEYRVGNLYINRTITGATVGRHPFGGGKLSGTGTKAGGADYLLNFLEPRTLCENTLRRGFAPEKS